MSAFPYVQLSPHLIVPRLFRTICRALCCYCSSGIIKIDPKIGHKPVHHHILQDIRKYLRIEASATIALRYDAEYSSLHPPSISCKVIQDRKFRKNLNIVVAHPSFIYSFIGFPVVHRRQETVIDKGIAAITHRISLIIKAYSGCDKPTPEGEI